MAINRPIIKTELPGPQAQLVLEKDKKYISPSYTRAYPLVVERGEGTWIYDVDGNKFLDLNAGIAVVATGHAHKEVVKIIQEQAARFIHMSGTDFYYPHQSLLAERLAEIVPGGPNKKTFLSCSGTEAIECAMKLARYNKKRPIFLAFFNAFHGRSLGALSLTASKPVQRRYFSPLLPQVVHIPFPNSYRPPRGVASEEVSNFVIDHLENVIFKTIAPPEEVSALFVEPIQGEGGYVVPPLDFYKRLKAILEKYDILFVTDEIQSGMGRTGKMFAMEHFGVIPDIVAIAKGIASGMPLGATVARNSLMDWEVGAHANTFGGNPISCAAALKTIELLEGGLVDNAARVGKILGDGLKELMEKYEFIGDVRGLGLMVGLEIVKDRETPDSKLRNEIVQTCFKRGLLLLGAGEATIRWSPPLVITEEEIGVALEIFSEVLSTLQIKSKEKVLV